MFSVHTVVGVVILGGRIIGGHNHIPDSLSVTLSHACFEINPKNLPAIFLYHMKEQSFSFSGAEDLGQIPTGSPPTRAPNRGEVG